MKEGGGWWRLFVSDLHHPQSYLSATPAATARSRPYNLGINDPEPVELRQDRRKSSLNLGSRSGCL